MKIDSITFLWANSISFHFSSSEARGWTGVVYPHSLNLQPNLIYNLIHYLISIKFILHNFLNLFFIFLQIPGGG